MAMKRFFGCLAAMGLDEAVQGFVTQDIAAVCERALEAGGSVPEPIRDIPEFGIKVAFVLDPEGHINEVIEMTASGG